MKGGGSLGWEPGEWTDDTSMALRVGLEYLPVGSCGTWARRLDEAEQAQPCDFTRNGPQAPGPFYGAQPGGGTSRRGR